MMMSGGHVLYVILFPLLAQVAADDADEQIMTQLLQQASRPSAAAGIPGPSSLLDASGSPSESLDSDNEEVSKRVFCNGFTGCGGRHRDRSRRQGRLYGKRLIPRLVKKPFCNSFGCYNGKRSVGSPMAGDEAEALAEAQEEFRARLGLARLLAASGSAMASRHVQQKQREGSEPRSLLEKRLFCNGYGGCRSFKRSLFSPWMSKMNGVVGASSRR